MSKQTRRRFLTRVAAGALAGVGASASLNPGAASGETRRGADLPVPTAPQLKWQDFEVGALVCYELHMQAMSYNQGEAQKTRIENVDLYNPTKLDTDQWLEAAKAMGARYAVFTASHESGFLQWQSDVYPYGLKQLKWRDGKGDVVRDFVRSCKRYGIAPGVFLGTRWNAHMGVLDFKVNQGKGDDPIKQAQYNRMVEEMVTEICARYGDLCELWFDAGAYSPDKGGPDVLPIFEKRQPNCVFYHNEQRADHRWAGNERGTAGYPCYATVPWAAFVANRNEENFFKILRQGDPDGDCWSPAMADAPLRNHEWFWRPGDERKVYPLDSLVDMYYKSVGRNANLIIGLTPDRDGLLPKGDMERCREFGNEIRRRFSTPLAETGGSGEQVVLTLKRPSRVNHVALMEDIAHGERVREYVVEGLVAGETWRTMCEGTSIGHKRIQHFPEQEVSQLRVRLTKSTAPPRIRSFAAYHADPNPLAD